MNNYPFKLPELPYSKDSLEPYISQNTLNYHYDKHHNAYVVNLNKLIDQTEYANFTLEEIISKTYGIEDKKAIFNNAGQVWNHTFYWHSMKKDGGGYPEGEIKSQIDRGFGSYENFKEEFVKSGVGQFGSGWVWLVWDYKENKLMIMKTANAELPLVHNKKALLVADVWEHAYYLDYQNLRPKYLETFLDNLVNWEFALNNFIKR